MKFYSEGNRIVQRKVLAADNREPAYFFEQEKVDELGFCDRPVRCADLPTVTHLCSRFDGHGGSCVALHKGEAAGRKVRRLEYA